MDPASFLNPNQREAFESTLDTDLTGSEAEVTWVMNNLHLLLQVAEGWLVWPISISFTYQTVHTNIISLENTHI